MSDVSPPPPAASIRRSLGLSFLEKYSSLALQLVSGMVVARLVTPEGFGVFSIAFAIVGFAHVIREMGVTSYLVHLPALEGRHIRAGLFATCVVAWGLGIGLIVASPLVGHLYGDDVRRAEIVLSFSFFVQPFSSTIFALLQREMNFGALLYINMVGTLANAFCAVVFSFAGWSFMGLAAASVVGQVATSGAAIYFRPDREHLIPSSRGAKDVFRFGLPIVMSSILQQFSTNIATLITARFVTAEAMGQLNRALGGTSLYGRLIMEAVGPLVLPMMCELQRAGKDVGAACWRSLDYICVVSWPFFLFLAICAEPLTVTLFGHQWIESARLLRFMSIGGIFWVVQPLAQPMLISTGRVQLNLVIQGVNQVIALVGVLLAAPFGIGAVAMAAIPISFLHAVTWFACLAFTIRVPSEIIRISARAALVTASALLLPWMAMAIGQQLGPWLQLVLACGGLGIGWLIGIFATNHPLAKEVSSVARFWSRGGPLGKTAIPGGRA